MPKHKKIISKIHKNVKLVEPNATVILYGSYARGTQQKDSDIDVLILLDKAKISRQDEKRVKYPLYDLEFDTGIIISPLVLTKKDWELRHKITPFYEEVMKEGIVL